MSHCRSYQSFEAYIYKEYLAYKTYNILTDRSFRVRLARIEYVDTEGKAKGKIYTAFFIEHVDDFAKRIGAKQIEDRFVLPSRYEHLDLCRADMFQFFIGNTDFSFVASDEECCHNGKVFALKDDSQGWIPVPYDFDLSGMVNAPYAAVDPHFPIQSVTERYYRGLGVSKKALEETLTQYLRKKSEIYDLWENFESLPENHRARSLHFIDQFYDILGNRSRVKKEIVKKLRHIGQLEKSIEKDILENN